MTSAGPVARTILIVEDNAINREGLAVILGGEGYEILTAENGREALDYLRAGRRVDLILLDMIMPVLDGWHFLRVVKQDAGLASVPIIVMTGTVLTREWAEVQGCAGFLHKPVEPETLLTEVRRCLS